MLAVRLPKPTRPLRRLHRNAHLLPTSHRVLQRQVPKPPSPSKQKISAIPNKRSSSPGFPFYSPNVPAEPPKEIRLPSALPIPVLHEVDRAPIEKSYPELAQVPTEYIRTGLRAKSAVMLSAVAGVRAEPPKDYLPAQINVPLDETVAAACPTHMLAVFSPSPKTASNRKERRKVTLYPVHSLVLTSHCNFLPPVPPRPTAPAPVNTLNLPVLPITLPAPDSFAILQTYLYTKRIDTLLASLLPSVPEKMDTHCTLTDMIAKTSKELGEEFSVSKLVRYALIINGVWRDACALGVYDNPLWFMLDLAWGSVVDGIRVAKRKAAEEEHQKKLKEQYKKIEEEAQRGRQNKLEEESPRVRRVKAEEESPRSRRGKSPEETHRGRRRVSPY